MTNPEGAMPAYPCSPKLEREICANNDGYGSIGLTKREVFAMAIMPVLVADNERHGAEFGFDSPAQVSKRAVEYADALLAALSDQPNRQEDA